MEAANFTHNSTINNIVRATENVIQPSTPLTKPPNHDGLDGSDTDTDHALTVPHLPASASRHTQCPTAGRSGVRASSNAARERSRVKTLRAAFLELQRTLPAVPKDTKLSKLDVLVLATTYIAHLTTTLARSSGKS